VDIFFETSRHFAFERTLPLLADGGRFVLITGIGSTVAVQIYLRDARLRGFVISNATVSNLADAATALHDGISRGLLRVRVGTRLPLEESAQTHRLMDNGIRGRIVVIP
jgi:NADPH:quinone reductase-like Zn-dependent oxidoreductase